VCAAYAAAKESARRRQLGATFMPWGKLRWAETLERFGGDPLPYGLTPVNREVIARLARYLRDQGFIETEPAVDALFAIPSIRA